MTSIKNFLLLTFLVILTACSNSMVKYSREEFSKNERGVVFFDVKEDKLSIPFVLKRYGKDEKFSIEHQNSGLIFSSEDKDMVKRMMFLEPGMYYITYISLLERGNLKRWYPGPGIKDSMIQYGAFEMKAGEVLSLGILNINDSKFRLEDNFSLLRSQLLESDNDELETKLKRGAFYNRGSLLLKDRNENIRIAPVEAVEAQRKQILKEITRRLEKTSK